MKKPEINQDIPPVEQPPVEQPPVEQPPVEQPPVVVEQTPENIGASLIEGTPETAKVNDEFVPVPKPVDHLASAEIPAEQVGNKKEQIAMEVADASPKYDQCLVICNVDSVSKKGTVSIVDILRTNVKVRDTQAKSDNDLIDPYHKGHSKLWFKSGTVKKGDTITV